MRLARYHGLGNDYLVLETGEAVSPALARALCDRRRGVGSDGILLPTPTDRADLGVTIVNPDGSVAEKSGNGLRILAQWWVDSGRAPGPRFTVWTGFDQVRCDVGAASVVVDMGTASFEPEDLPMASSGPWIDHALEVAGVALRLTTVSVGNPHCVAWFPSSTDLDALPLDRIGPALERHAAFPNRTNVQLARVLGPGVAEARIWERGAGVTEASGSSSCAVVATGVRTGRLAEGTCIVRMPGGELIVGIDGLRRIRLEGPVVRVCTLEVDSSWLASQSLC